MRFSVSPTQVQVLTRDGFYVSVEGSGVGWVCCQGTRRWVFGTFREKFVLFNPPQTPAHIVVMGRGLGGSCQTVVSVEARTRMRTPQVFGNPRFRRPIPLPVAPRPTLHVPSVRGLRARIEARWNAFLERETQRPHET